MQAYRDSNNGVLGNAAAAATDWVSNNWEYIAAGALIVGGVAVMCTGVGGPIGAAMIAGAATGAGSSIWSQKSSNGSVDWGKVAIDGTVGAATGLAGGGAAAAAAKMTTGVTSCLGRSVLAGAIEGGLDGGASGGINYLTSGQPLTMDGFLNATGQGALEGSLTGGAGGALAKVTDVARYGCFTKDTPVLMADGTAKPIQDIVAGDEVMAFNADTGVNEPATVTRTFTHEDVETLVVRTDQGDITTTATHPFYVENRGYTPAGQLHQGDHLHTPDGNTVQVLNIQSTGQHHTVHNLEVNGHHNYHVATNSQTWILVHNNDGCGPTGTVWDDVTPTTSAVHPNSGLPRSFNLDTPNGTIHVHPNASEHIEQTSLGALRETQNPALAQLRGQYELSGMQNAVTEYMEGGVRLNQPATVQGWQLELRQGESDPLPALIHARSVG